MRYLVGFTSSLVFASVLAYAQPKQLPEAQLPRSVEAAVPHIIAALRPAQRSIVQGTPKENLFMLQGEWADDIEALLGLNNGNTALIKAACGEKCNADDAAFELMKAAWEELHKRATIQATQRP